MAPCGATDHEIVRQAIAATYGMVEMIDDAVGRILATVDRVGAGPDGADDTIVVFTSDHGDMMGEHGLMLKGFMHYRGTLQVPLVIRAPGRMPGGPGPWPRPSICAPPSSTSPAPVRSTASRAAAWPRSWPTRPPSSVAVCSSRTISRRPR